MARNEAKIKFTADTQAFTAQVKSANSTLASLRAAMALNEAEFKNTGDSAQYLTNKQKILTEELQANSAKQAALNEKLEAAKKYYGENSNEAADWEGTLTRARIEEQKLITALNECNAALDANSNDVDEAADEYDELSEATKDASEAAKDGAGGWTAAKSVLADLATKSITMVIDKLKEAAKAVINLGTEFTASLSNVAALSGATASEMAQMEARAKELGRTTIFSAKNVSDAFGYMALAGWDTSQSLAGIDGVLNLAAASGMDLAQASDMVTDYLSAFGLEASDAAGMVDVLAYAQANSNTTTEQLGQAFGNSAAMMHTAGQSMETTTALLEALANQGLKGSEAGTALSAMMRDITQKMDGGRIMIGDTAVAVQDASGNFRNMIDILADVEAATEGMGSAEKSAALMTTFTARSVKGVSTILTEGTDNLKDYESALNDCTGTASEMTTVMNDNLAGDMKALNSAAEGLGLALFDYFEGPLRGAADIATKALNAITDFITDDETELQSFISEIKAANDEAASLIDRSAETMSGAMDNVAELEYYKDLLLDLNGKTELTEFEQYQLKNAVESLGDTIPELSSAFDETNGTLDITNEELVKLFDNAQSVAMQTALIEAQQDSYAALAEATLAKAKADSAVEKATEEYNRVLEENKEKTDDLSMNVVGMNNETLTYSQTLHDAQKAQEDATKAMEDAQTQIDDENRAYAELREQYGLAAETIGEAADAQDKVAESTQGATEAGEEFIGMTEEEIEAAKKAAEEIQKAYEDMRDGIDSSIRSSISLMDEFSGGAEISADEIEANLQSQIAGISNWADNMKRLGDMAGEGFSQELYDHLAEMGPESANLVQELIDTLDSDREQFDRISSEYAQALALTNDAELLASYTTAGKNAAAEFGAGIEAGETDVKASVSDMSKAASSGADFSDLGEEAKKASGEVESGMKQGVTNTLVQTALMKAAAKAGGQSMRETLQNEMSGIPSDAANAMSGAVAAVNSGISQMRTALSTTLRGPNIQVPHFTLTGSFNLTTKEVPKVSVDWYAKGGIFTQPTLIPNMYGVGEAGAEAVLPIDTLKEYISDAMETASAAPVNVYMTVDGATDPEAWAVDFSRELKQIMRIS